MGRTRRGKVLQVVNTLEKMSEVEKEKILVQKDLTKPVTEFKTIAERVAKSSLYYKNFYVPELEKAYRPYERFRRIDKVFPYARLFDGLDTVKLLVDEPNNDMEIDQCVKKAIILKELGYHYCFIDKDADIIGVLQQLGVY